MNELRTEAGRRLLAFLPSEGPDTGWYGLRRAILAIEAEARAQGALHERLISEGEEAARTADRPSLREAAEATVAHGKGLHSYCTFEDHIVALRQALGESDG